MIYQKRNTMTTLINQTGSKEVNIFSNMGSFLVMYVQVYKGEKQVLESKTFATFKRAFKWGEIKLS